MKYWVYINNKVDGPYDEANLADVAGFTPQTLICSEEVASNGGQEWVKASSIFEFDEVPVQEQPAAQSQPPAVSAASGTAATPDTQALLEKLEVLTSGMSSLQAKLDQMQTHLDQALEHNKQLAAQAAAAAATSPLPSEEVPPQEDFKTNTITLTRHSFEQTQPTLSKEEVKEEDVVIRSALDSMYGGKLIEETTPEVKEETFHDLVTGETSADLERNAQQRLEEEAVEDIATQLHFTPIDSDEAEQPAPQEEEPSVEKATITTPSLLEAQKDALINELTAPSHEDVLDQIIAEHQQEAAATQTTQPDGLPAAGVAGAVAGAALAAAAAFAHSSNEKEPAPLTMATDKENPTHLEEVLPPDQMPEDVLPPDTDAEEPAQEQPTLSSLPPAQEEEPAQEPTVEEPAPGADLPVMEDAAVQPAVEEPAPQPAEPDLPVMSAPEELPQMQEEPAPQPAQDLPSLDAQEEPALAQQEEVASLENMAQPVILQAEETLQELVPQQQQQPDESPAQEEQPAAEESAAQEEQPAAEEPAAQEEQPAAEEPAAQEKQPAAEEPAAQEEEEVVEPGAITAKDLQDAFGEPDPQSDAQQLPTPEEIAQEEASTAAEGNPNELTEIELKEGSTYLISDFVPPAQLAAQAAPAQDKTDTNTHKDSPFQDMLAASTVGQSTKPLSTDGLPDDLSATQINLENTIQAKRGASLDIKTVPMVPDPAKGDRLNLDDLNDVNAQHGLKKSSGLGKLTKLVVVGLVFVLLLIILYVALGMFKLLPSSVNVFASKEDKPSIAQQASEEFLQEQPAQPQEPSATEIAQDKVQNFPLPNGYTLKGFIESKYASVSPELITWEVTEAVEPDNYSVTVKVPPENPQNFKTVYRFNYNMQTGMLDPTISDAKNLLDQAYGVQQAQEAAKPAPAPAKKTTGRRRRSSK